MAFTKAYAKLLAGMLTPAQLELFRFLCGKGPFKGVWTTELMDELVSLELVEIACDVALLTSRGKKVAQFV